MNGTQNNLYDAIIYLISNDDEEWYHALSPDEIEGVLIKLSLLFNGEMRTNDHLNR